MDTEDHDTPEKERGRLAEAPGAVLKQYQGNYVSWNFYESRQEAVYVRVTVQVGSVED